MTTTGSTEADRQVQEKVCAYEYTIKRGDSFYLIAHRLGIPLRDLLEANSEINPARLMVGDVLCIPMEEDDAPPESAKPTPEPPAEPEPAPDQDAGDMEEDLDRPAQPEESEDSLCPAGQQRTIQAGETVTDIQLESDVTLHALRSANPDADLDALQAGQVLCIPSEDIPCDRERTIILQSGDNIETLALRLDTSVGALLRANPCLAPSAFTEGACIRVPGV